MQASWPLGTGRTTRKKAPQACVARVWSAGETVTLALASSGAVWQLASHGSCAPGSMEDPAETGPLEVPLQHPGLPSFPRQLLAAVHVRQVGRNEE